MFKMESQDISDRRVYVVRPRAELIEKLKFIADSGCIEQLTLPQVVMTDELPFEQFLEGWRTKILELCKLSFLKENFTEYPLLPKQVQAKLFGSCPETIEDFDKWWVCEEAEYIQIPTNWKK